MKLYTFTNSQDQIIEQVRAFTHSEALMLAVHNSINWKTDFFSEVL